MTPFLPRALPRALARALACLLAIAALCPFTAALAQEQPFEAFVGDWQGKGQLSEAQGDIRHTLLCRMSGAREDPRTVTIMLRCASRQDSRTLRLTLTHDSAGQVASFRIAEPAKLLRGAVTLRQDGPRLTLRGDRDSRLTFAPEGADMRIDLAAPGEGKGAFLLQRRDPAQDP
ncbi:MAG: hypothetical protein GYB53_03745 [Rhodobacteraceae bacterium]|nr:hypothetical protein [Paracoccaceae bacterium]MBR9822839.1 hypothetical protein [Paracoccaceae bacterium]